MISVSEAEEIILSHRAQFGDENVPLEKAGGRILAENITADRDMPPFERVTMDGIALQYSSWEEGMTSFRIVGMAAAGDPQKTLEDPGCCLEVMTGALLPLKTDTVIRYEDITAKNGSVHVKIPPKKGQNVHSRGSDRKEGDILLTESSFLDPTAIALCATVGKGKIKVRRLPRVLIVSTGNELVEVSAKPLAHQIRKSNTYQLMALLASMQIPADTLHLVDDSETINDALKGALNEYEVIMLSGGVSMGKFDHVPAVLENLGVIRHFHKVRQRPGKPFWFGTFRQRVHVFAFPGNPVSTFLCAIRYFNPWLSVSLGMSYKKEYARLADSLSFPKPLTWFALVKLIQTSDGCYEARAVEGNGSGDMVSLAQAHAFLEVPENREQFTAGELFPVFRYR